MYAMILKMSSITALYVLLTVLIWKHTQGRTLTAGRRILIGLVYGICSILSTHFAVDYSQMLLNVRDLGPLIAGSFFSPVSGIIAGLIGGIERYIAGTYWGIGSYTRIACSVSTCLAGFIAAAIHIFIFKRKKPSAVYAFFMGAVMEIFHMYVVLITHRDDMNMAFYVVRTCSLPMIVFTGLGMAVSSIVLRICTGEWRNPFRRVSTEDVPVSRRFQFWLFAVTFSILALNLLFSFTVQTQTAEQAGQDTVSAVSEDIRQAYHRLRQTETGIKVLTEETVMTAVQTIAETMEDSGGTVAADASFLARMMDIFGLEAVSAVNANGQTVASAGRSELLDGIWNGIPETTLISSDSLAAAAARCGDGMVLAAISRDRVSSALNFPGLNDALSYYHVGNEGTFDIFGADGVIAAGNHMGEPLSAGDLEIVTAQPAGVCFRARLFDSESLCRIEQLNDGMTLLVRLPMASVYFSRDAQTYETAFADIILFAVVYVLVSMLVQGIVVNNLELVQASLDRIADGNMDEVVSVRSSSEFTSLSDNINQTVSVLKGYIDAAEKRIEEELEFARIIQDSSLPKNFLFPRNEFSVYAMMDPAREVGGDFYDFFFVDQNKLALVVADVSGKGIPAALFMMRAKTAIRGLAESGRAPSEIFRRANETLCEGNDAEMFVTVWLGIIDLQTGRMVCANAGHEYPALMCAGGDFELIRDQHSFVLAGMEQMRYQEYELDLNPGDILFLYTDGIPEAINEKTEQYGTERLLRVLNSVKAKPMQAVLQAVREDIAGFVGAADQFDDITMLGFAYFGAEKIEPAPKESET